LLAADTGLPLDLSDVEWRTLDGTNNNLELPDQGAARTQQIRFGYGDRFPDENGDQIITAPQGENPRTISNELHAQSGDVLSERQLTDWIFTWGQFVTHDMDLTLTGTQWNVLSDGSTGNFNIPVTDPGDPLFPFIPFNRSEFAEGTGENDVRRDVVNSVTSYIDASQVYGSDAERAAALRTFEGGKLLLDANGMLPLNDVGLPNDDALGLGDELFLAGDIRANEQVGLTASHTLFAREHNRLADQIAETYPDLTDEEIYQFARRIVGAQMQIITYEEYLPAMLGFDLAPSPEDAVYNSETDASITNSFAHGAFRFGHSQISEESLLVNGDGETVDSIGIRDAFFNPDFFKSDPANLDLLLKGLASQVAQENDLLHVDGVRNNLFGPPGAGGLDLAALDIQRGRDHGLPDYNNLRDRYGLEAVTSFAEITSDPEIQAKLEEVFGNVDNIDLFTGALAEDHLPGSSAGELIHAIVGNQFERLRDGDRFFYTQDAFLQSEEVARVIDLETVTLANIIRWNTGVSNIQDNVFFESSVLIVEAPESGASVSIIVNERFVTVIDNETGGIIARQSQDDVSRVIFAGSNSSQDTVNLFMANANSSLENGVEVYGGDSADDVLRLYGRLAHDDFTVSNGAASVNENDVLFSDIESLEIATLLGRDTVDVEDDLPFDVIVRLWHDPTS